jgi:PLP dependent protein
MDSRNLNKVKLHIDSMPRPVTVVAITKTFPYEIVKTAHDKGYRHFGENRVEEAREKIERAQSEGFNGIVWHMIGHVQSRKVPDVVRLFDRVDSVDSMGLARELDREAEKLNNKIHMLLEVNLTGEATKFGFDLADWEHNPEKLRHFYLSIDESMSLKNILVDGLMTMPPYVANAEDNRAVFRSMKRLSEAIRTQTAAFGAELSMGTSCDYTVAIEEGATQVRLGEILFGKRA